MPHCIMISIITYDIICFDGHTCRERERDREREYMCRTCIISSPCVICLRACVCVQRWSGKLVVIHINKTDDIIWQFHYIVIRFRHYSHTHTHTHTLQLSSLVDCYVYLHSTYIGYASCTDNRPRAMNRIYYIIVSVLI